MSLSLGQSFTCNDGSFTVTSVACSANVLTFTVTSDSPTMCTTFITLNIPADVTVNGNPQANVSQFFLFGSGDFTISIATANCAPVAMSLNYLGACTACIPQPFVLSGPSAPIPTMGQWSLIILALMLSIGGILVYKSRFAISKLVSLRSIHK